MVFRVTSQASQQSVTNNVFRLSEQLSKTQNALSSGKRISAPSDDPGGNREILALRTTLQQTQQFIRNVQNIKNFADISDSALDDVGQVLIRAKELAVSQLGGVATAQTRGFTATEINSLIAQVVQTANTRIGDRYMFSGSKVNVQPFLTSASGAIYQGNTEAIRAEIGRNENFQFNLPGSSALAADLNPSVDTNTLVSDLNAGAGVPAGSFRITDQAGNTGTVTVTVGMTVGNLVSAINSAGTNVTASINSVKNGLKLSDSSTIITQGLTVAEVGGGTTADKLGILGQRNGTFEGRDINPKLNASTLISQLNGGSGLTLASINIVNGSASGTISLSSANTVGDVLNAINNAGLNVTAGIGSQGNDLRVVSNNNSTVPIVRNVGNGSTASDLGMGAGQNVITSLIQLKTALEKNDSAALQVILDNLDSNIKSVAGSRANIGSISRRLILNNTSLDKAVVDRTERLSNVQDVDFAQKASELAALELAFRATLDTSSRILQPSILDFLR